MSTVIFWNLILSRRLDIDENCGNYWWSVGEGPRSLTHQSVFTLLSRPLFQSRQSDVGVRFITEGQCGAKKRNAPRHATRRRVNVLNVRWDRACRSTVSRRVPLLCIAILTPAVIPRIAISKFERGRPLCPRRPIHRAENEKETPVINTIAATYLYFPRGATG